MTFKKSKAILLGLIMLFSLFASTQIGAVTTVTLNVESADMSGTTFPGQWVELWQNGVIIQEGFTPFSATIESGVQYEVFIHNDPAESKFFNNWEDGSINPTRVITVTQDTTLTAFFQTSPVATASIVTQTVRSVDMSGVEFPGQWIELWLDGVIIQENFTPFTATLEAEKQYGIFIYDAAAENKFFDHWDDGSTSRARPIAISQDTTMTAFFQTVSDTTSGTPGALSITRTSPGLVASDSLTTPKTKEQLQADSTDLWTFGGSATVQNAPIDFFQDAQGMHIGVQAVSSGAFAGFFAVTPNFSAQLFHAVITTEQGTIPDNFFNNGLFVQTGDPNFVNFVTCVAITSSAGTTWHLFRTTSSTETQATGFELLWSDPGTNQQLTRECTIVTNGSNFLRLYMDGVLVYESNTLDLNMVQPFRAFLEVQNSFSGAMLFGTYTEFYATTNEVLTVTNLPNTASRVQLLDANNNVIVDSSAIANGVATMDIGMLSFPVIANIRVIDSSGSEIASTSSLQSIFGGDVFSTSSQ